MTMISAIFRYWALGISHPDTKIRALHSLARSCFGSVGSLFGASDRFRPVYKAFGGLERRGINDPMVRFVNV